MPAECNGVRALTHRKWWKSGLRYRFVVVIGRLGGQVGRAGQPGRTGWCACESRTLEPSKATPYGPGAGIRRREKLSRLSDDLFGQRKRAATSPSQPLVR